MEYSSPSSRARVQASLSKLRIKPRQGATVYAYANHGRWVADCPCYGAELVAPDEPMVCGTCGRTHTVVFPDNFEQIDGLLEGRPKVNRNWLIGEPLTQLQQENAAHGVK